ncbi:MAG: GAF domain-containing protein [Candidatus Dormibacter sp.]
MVAQLQYPANETARLAAIRRYDILDTPPDGTFDRITSLAARILKTPIAIISIVDHDRIWFKSKLGVDAEEIDRAPGLCASAILNNVPWIVEDARKDPRTLANPLVVGEFGLQFYAGVPLTTLDGHNLGTMCVIDREPRRMSADDVAVLEDLAALVIDELELRLATRMALQLNDDVVQTLAVGHLALESGDTATVASSLSSALNAAKGIIAAMGERSESLRRERE